MECRCFKDAVRLVLEFIHKFPCPTTLLFLIVFLLTFSNLTGFLTHLAIFVTICEIALVNFALCQIKKMSPTNDMLSSKTQLRAEQAVFVHSERSACGSSNDFSIEQRIMSAVHLSKGVLRFQGLVNWALDVLARHILQDIDKEELGRETGLEGCGSTTLTETMYDGAVINASKREMGVEGGSSEKYALNSRYESSKNTIHTVGIRKNILSSPLQHDGEETDLPELEECSSSGEDEVICKTVLESTACVGENLKSKVDGGIDIEAREPTSEAVARSISVDEDTNSVDKHQILPPELCDKSLVSYKTASLKLPETLSSIAKDVTDLVAKLEQITDAGDFYTLEGDVLWDDSDARKLQVTKRLDGSRSTSKRRQFNVLQDHELSSDDYMIYPYKMQQSQVENVEMPLSRIAKGDRVDASNRKGRSSAVIRGASRAEVNEDAPIDQELKAIAHGRLKKGEDPGFVSSTTSFREFEECWPEFVDYCSSPPDLTRGKVHRYGRDLSLLGVKEPDITEASSGSTGCCDQPKVCIAHSRSRSKILQSDPLLSSESLIREQEMDVLWQEYNEDSARKSNNLKQRIKAQEHSSVKLDEKPQGLKTAEGNSLAVANLSPHSSEEPGSGNASTCMEGCWQAAYKARRLPRRKYFLGICRMLKDLGLKQCIQSSKVKN